MTYKRLTENYDAIYKLIIDIQKLEGGGMAVKYTSDINIVDGFGLVRVSELPYALRVGKIYDADFKPRLSGRNPLLHVYLLMTREENPDDIYVKTVTPQGIILVSPHKNSVKSEFSKRKEEFMKTSGLTRRHWRPNLVARQEYEKYLMRAMNDMDKLYGLGLEMRWEIHEPVMPPPDLDANQWGIEREAAIVRPRPNQRRLLDELSA